MRIDGGLAASRYLCQRIADVLDVDVSRPTRGGITALGAANAAAAALDRETDLTVPDGECRTFEPNHDAVLDYDGWQRAIEVARGWDT